MPSVTLPCGVIAWAFLSCLGAVAQTRTISPAEPSWPRLEHATAWVYLGDVRSESGELATQPRVRANRLAGSTAVPDRGDVLELVTDVELYIYRYRTDGERYRLEHPPDGIVTDNDRTGLRLTRLSLLQVDDVYVEPAVHGLQGVWVRVSPMPAFR